MSEREASLKESHGRVAGPRGAAAKLGIPRQTLEWKIRNLNIDKLAFKREEAGGRGDAGRH